MYNSPLIEITILLADDILTESLDSDDIWNDGKPGDNTTEDDEL